MKINLEVNNKTQSPLAEDFFSLVAEKTITAAGYEFLHNKNISISLALVSEEEMQELNNKYRHKDSVTDVLSFCEYETAAEIENVSGPELFLGELILCYDDIRKYAQEKNIELQKEIANVVSHGVLHLLGLAHGEKMFALQEAVVSKI